jgi:hypothetical protein
MSKFWKIVFIGMFAVLAFDTIASYASLILGFPYENASIGSILIYGAIGYICFRCCGFLKALTAALLVEIIDSTLGWYLSWVIGPGALPPEQTNNTTIGITIIMVMIFAVVCSALGAGAARLVQGNKNA